MKKPNGKLKKFIILGVVIIVIAICLILNGLKPETYRTFAAAYRDIKNVVSGSGTIEAAKSRKEYAKVSAEVENVYFKEGDKVKSGDLIMELDSEDYKTKINSQEIAIEQLQISKQSIQKQIKDLTIVANDDGYVSGLAITEGSYVATSSAVCNLIKDSAYEIVLQYVYNSEMPITIGSKANVIVVNTYASMEGTVTKVSDMRKAIYGNIQVVDVTIEVATTGYSMEGIAAKAEINVNGTNLASVNQSTFSKVQGNVVRAKSTGTVKTLKAFEGMKVKKGDVIAVLENSDLQTSLDNANLSLKTQYNQLELLKDGLENYEIVSKIDGTITAQELEEGDLVSAGTMLTSISNNDYLEFEIAVDELDVAKLNYDQIVYVTIDALPETEANPIEGRISLIPLEGKSTAGITDYYVTIQISGDENIRISMSANADIVTSSAENVLCIPVDAITTELGKSYVEVVQGEEKITREIEIGASDSTYVEVKSGLKEGDLVVIPETSAMHMPSATSMMQMSE